MYRIIVEIVPNKPSCKIEPIWKSLLVSGSVKYDLFDFLLSSYTFFSAIRSLMSVYSQYIICYTHNHLLYKSNGIITQKSGSIKSFIYCSCVIFECMYFSYYVIC